jgi:hypothetical protein
MFNLPTISEKFSESLNEAIFEARVREEDQLPASYGKTFEEFYGIEKTEEAPEPKFEIAEANVRVIPDIETPKQKFEMAWPNRTSLSKVLKITEGLDLSKWGYVSEHWQGKSKFYLRLEHHEGATLYRVSENTYSIIKDQYDWARETEMQVRRSETPKSLRRAEARKSPERASKVEEEIPEHCSDDCEYRWGDNCAAPSHWRDEDTNEYTIIKTKDDLRNFNSTFNFETAEMIPIRYGSVNGEDLARYNKIAFVFQENNRDVAKCVMSRMLGCELGFGRNKF